VFGATFMAIAAEHPIALAVGKKNPAIAAFIEECRHGAVMEADLATQEKKGLSTGLHVLHPFTGRPIDIWVANYVLMGYGEGAVMGVPAHDERDFEFAHKHALPVVPVIKSKTGAYDRAASEGIPSGDEKVSSSWNAAYSEYGITHDSGEFSGLEFQAAVDAIAAALQSKGLGRKRIQYRLRDWGISRQRYWGTPIPIIHCEACGAVPVPEADLPVVLPEDLIPDGTGNPLNKDERFVACKCPQCGKPARRETDTMDTFVDSSWYYMRYCCPDARTMVDERTDYWMPMDQYIGGIEHAVLHLLYARFWTKVMRDLGLIKFDEPFKHLFTQGMLLAHCYFREDASGRKRWFYPAEVEQQFDERGTPVSAVATEDGKPVNYGGIEKMSKSKNNVVEPGVFIQRFGADTARAFVMFAGPPDQSAPWSDTSAEGVYKFLKRLWAFCHERRERIANAPALVPASLDTSLKKVRHELHVVLQQALFDYQRVQYNTVVSATMKMLKALDALEGQPGADALLRESMSILLRTLYPIAPHITHVLWVQLGYAKQLGDLLDAPMPMPAEDALRQDQVDLVVQVNGKLRGRVTVAANAAEEDIKAAALADEHVRRFVDKPIRKVICVPGKLINIVV
jgi:leucyl-tRNA synthetase